MEKITRQSFLSRWFDGCEGNMEIRVLPTGSQGFFLVGDLKGIDTFISKHTDADVYFGVSTRKGKSGTKADVLHIPGVWIDIDFKTTPKKEANKLIKECLLLPTFAVQSGGGYHVYWRFTEPTEDIDAVERINRQLAQFFNSDPVGNADRILRVPDTFNYKYTPRRPVKCVSCKDTAYELIDFDTLPPLKAGNNGSVNPPGWKEQVIKGTTPGNRHADGTKLVGACIRMGLDDSGIEAIMEHWDGNNSVSLKVDYGKDELSKIIQSVRKKDNRSQLQDGRDIPDEIHEWLKVAGDEFSIEHLIRELGLLDDADPKQRRKMRNRVSLFLRRMVDKGDLESHTKHGWFRQPAQEEVMNILAADTTPSNLILPLKLSLVADLLPGVVVAFAGSKDSGKTTLALNVAKDNMHTWDVTYLNSEMYDVMMRKRLELFTDTDIRSWDERVKFVRCGDQWADIIKRNNPGPGKLFICDYIQDYEEAWRMASHINQVHEALNGATAIVALQKNVGKGMGYGGERTRDKPVLYVNLDKGLATISSIKAWKTPYNPNGRQMIYKIGGGSYVKPVTEWEEPKEVA